MGLAADHAFDQLYICPYPFCPSSSLYSQMRVLSSDLALPSSTTHHKPRPTATEKNIDIDITNGERRARLRPSLSLAFFDPPVCVDGPTEQSVPRSDLPFAATGDGALHLIGHAHGWPSNDGLERGDLVLKRPGRMGLGVTEAQSRAACGRAVLQGARCKGEPIVQASTVPRYDRCLAEGRAEEESRYFGILDPLTAVPPLRLYVRASISPGSIMRLAAVNSQQRPGQAGIYLQPAREESPPHVSMSLRNS
ncbi:hypothetical protein TESG_08147 [Trichophyton tonsurans CBS 112818]|uniref:Uncharacterized protein n=1 Tax=Trichophyton tonsurans (strain CBS 112818) TaxID=647933 RepID=F2SB92_TRIT1|nr:hypothetical protein TESG_08147 [Trichophyton tonsurans CBS 112818]